jgi:hypothetical protein
MQTPQQKIRTALRRHLRKLDEARRAYAAADRALARALKHGISPGQPIRLQPGSDDRHVITDNSVMLARKGSIYRPARLSRYTLDPVRQTKT